MSPKKQVNHNIRKHFNSIIYNISRYTEIALSIVILVVIALAGILPDHGNCKITLFQQWIPSSLPRSSPSIVIWW